MTAHDDSTRPVPTDDEPRDTTGHATGPATPPDPSTSVRVPAQAPSSTSAPTPSPVATATATAPAPASAPPAPTYLAGPAPFPILLGLLGVLLAVGVVVGELTDLTLPWTDLGPWSVVAAGLVVLVVGAIGLRSSRSQD
jgi:hypothetical protein